MAKTIAPTFGLLPPPVEPIVIGLPTVAAEPLLAPICTVALEPLEAPLPQNCVVPVSGLNQRFDVLADDCHDPWPSVHVLREFAVMELDQ